MIQKFLQFIKSNLLVILSLALFLTSLGYYSNQKGYLKLPFVSGATIAKSATESGSDAYDYCLDQKHWDGINKENCYSKYFKQISEENGASYAFDALATLQQIDSTTLGCHLIAHGIGWGAYLKDPNDWRELIQTMNPGCSYGAIHGVIENYVATLPEGKLPKELVPSICGESPRADCNHIIGHLILVQTKGSIDEALDYCRVFQDNKTQLNFCFTGVFMEYQTALNLIDHGLAPKSWLDWPARVPELEKMCRSYSGDEGASCWEEIIHAALVKFNNDPEQIFAFCSTSQLVDGALRCRRHAIGVMTAAYEYDLDKMKPMCDIPQKNDPSFKNDCYASMAGSTLSTLPNDTKKVSDFCESLDTQYQSACFYQINVRNTQRPAGD